MKTRAGLQHLGQVRQHHVDHVPRDVRNHPSPLGLGNEFIGWHQGAVAATPAQQRLGPHPLAGLQVHDGLVEHKKFAPSQGRPQPDARRQLPPGEHRHPQRKQGTGDQPQGCQDQRLGLEPFVGQRLGRRRNCRDVVVLGHPEDDVVGFALHHAVHIGRVEIQPLNRPGF